MDKMNLFNHKEKSSKASLNKGNERQKTGEINVDYLLQRVKNLQNALNKFTEEVASIIEEAESIKSNKSKVIDTPEAINTSEVVNVSKAPIQDETGILCFRQADVVSPSYNMQLDNDKVYIVDINSLESQDNCVKQLKEDTGIDFAWNREEEGKKHRILYDTRMYYVDKAGYFSYDECKALIPLMPLNGTSCYLMFACLQNLTTIDFSYFCTNNVITMELMFNYSEKLNTLDLSSFDTSSVTDMNFMFCDCKSLTQLNLSSFNTENVKYLNSMFENCVSLWKLDLSSFSTKSAMHFTKTFAGCENLYHIDVSHKWILNEDAENNEVFNDCYRLPHYRDSRLGTEMFCSVNEGGYFHYVGEEDDYE